MSELLPSQSEASPEQTGELQALWLDSEDAGELLSSLSSDTARNVLTTLHDEPSTASEIAERVDTSLQNARHHLGNLQDAGLVRVAETRYSSKGREMNVYAPSENPMVVFVGNQDAEESSSVLDALREMLPVVGLLAMASLLVQWVVTLSTGTSAPGELPRFGQDLTGPAGVALPVLPPGLVFLLGGLLVLAGIVAIQHYRE
ncbi:ArsR/SmtB family transcription factor [Halorarius litoreus]|uniref:ArsR/SmtB family transcription factor n=1 Tax=Halorarius litoreus TaxID=2962676 RepID=UPI0020CEC7B3|nr:helix-turn-helix domain-containing protein [Halorarius litoreus]